jgi:5-methylcytosine-specific restriction endonuclease McrA
VSGSPYYSSPPHWRRLRRAALKRDSGRCTVPGCFAPAPIVDHIVTRPRGVTRSGPEDRLTICVRYAHTHDAQIEERRDGQRGLH